MSQYRYVGYRNSGKMQPENSDYLTVILVLLLFWVSARCQETIIGEAPYARGTEGPLTNTLVRETGSPSSSTRIVY